MLMSTPILIPGPSVGLTNGGYVFIKAVYLDYRTLKIIMI